jgi:spore germination protein GerM
VVDKPSKDSYSEQEAQQRFAAAVKAALNTKPKPLKSMTPKGVPAQSKKRQKGTTE